MKSTVIVVLVVATTVSALAQPPPPSGDELAPLEPATQPTPTEATPTLTPTEATPTNPAAMEPTSAPAAPSPEPASNPPSFGQPASAPAKAVRPDPYQACLVERRWIGKRIEATTDRRARGQLLLSMPDCQALRLKPIVEPETSAGTSEISVGLGVFSIAGISQTRFGGLDLGVGGFVSPRLALTARLAGGTIIESDVVAYVGVLGPNAQYWLDDHIWLGGGLGLGFMLASAGGDDSAAVAGSGVDLRAGYSFGQRGNSWNVSVEATSFSEGMSFAMPFDDRALTVLSFLVGYQTAPKPNAIARHARPIDPDALVELAREASEVGACDTVKRIELQLRDVHATSHVQGLHENAATARCLAP